MLKLLICCFSENKAQLTCNQLKTKEIIFQDCNNIFLALFFFSRLRKIKVNVQSPDQIFLSLMKVDLLMRIWVECYTHIETSQLIIYIAN